jgi:ribonuclease P protein component
MLSHKFRFHGHGSLRYLYRNGKTARTRSLLLRYSPNKFRVNSRYAVIVAKKVLKAAARRNRIRRRIYEVIRLHEADIPDGYDYSLTVFSAELMTIPYDELEREIVELFRQVKPTPETAER